MRLALARLVPACLAAVLSIPAQAADLVMFEQEGCPFCAAWNRDVAPVLPKTDEGKRLTLRRIDIRAPRPPDLQALGDVRVTPTFVVLEAGREVGRIVGYAGDEQFWSLLGPIVRRLDNKGAAQP